MIKAEQGQSIIDTRVAIAQGAREIFSHGISDPVPLKAFVKLGQKPMDVWLDHLPERFQILAVLADLVVNRALENRQNLPPYGLVLPTQYTDIKSPEGIKNLDELRESMRRTLLVAEEFLFDELDEKAESKPEDPIASAYKRYNEFIDFGLSFAQSGEELRLEPGYNTAVDVMADALTHILLLYRRDHPKPSPTIHDIVQTAQNSWPYIAKKASLHAHELSYAPDRPDAHVLVSSKNGYRLEHTKEVEIQILLGPRYLEPEGRYNHPTFGCPAIVNFDGKSAIRKLWDWNITAAEQIYNDNYKGNTVNMLLGIMR